MILKLFLSFLLFGLTYASADEPRRTVESAVTRDSLGTKSAVISVPGNTIVTTDSISLISAGIAGNVGVVWQLSSAATKDVFIAAERSFQRPATEDAAETTYLAWNNAVETSDTSWHMITLDTIIQPYLRFKLSGKGSNNDSTTTIQIKVMKQ